MPEPTDLCTQPSQAPSSDDRLAAIQSTLEALVGAVGGLRNDSLKQSNDLTALSQKVDTMQGSYDTRFAALEEAVKKMSITTPKASAPSAAGIMDVDNDKKTRKIEQRRGSGAPTPPTSQPISGYPPSRVLKLRTRELRWPSSLFSIGSYDTPNGHVVYAIHYRPQCEQQALLPHHQYST